MKNKGWHITDDGLVKKCTADKQPCHYKKHYRYEAVAKSHAALHKALKETSKVVRNNNIKNVSNPMLENIEFVQKRPPQIYAFTVPDLAEGLHATKVGDTTRGVEVRLREWRQKGGIYANLKLEFNLDASFEADGETVYVRDYNFHTWLRSRGYQALTEILDEYPHLREAPEGVSQEFYFNREDRELKITEEMLRKSLQEQKDMYGKPASPYAYYTEVRGQQVSAHYAPVNEYEMRPFQADIVGKAVKYFRSTPEEDPQFLLSAPTRSGKSFMAANTVSQLFEASPKKNNCAVIVSGFAEIEDEWKATFESHKKFAKEDGKASENKCGVSPCECGNKFKYLSVSDLKRNKNAVQEAYEDGYDNVAVFLTLQDLSGSTKDDSEVKEVHAFLKEEGSVDFLIGDEAHFAMFSDGRYQDSIKQSAVKGETDDALLDMEVSEAETAEIGEMLGTMSPTQGKLFVTATPYNNVPWGTKYNQSVNAAVVRESDIRKEKEAWDAANAMKDEPAAEWANPSYGLPEKKMFGVDVGMSPNELFRMSGTKFANEAAVREFIQGFFGTAPGETTVPNFFGSKEFADAGLGNHIYATLPSRKACDAFEAELNKVFKDRGVDGYEVLNISSNKPRHLTSKKRAAEIKDDITRHAESGKKTITVTCNRMGTGVTQEHWDTVLILRTMSSAQQFQQTAGRAGTPRVSSRNNMSDKVRQDKSLCRNCETRNIRAVGTYLCEQCFNKGGDELEDLKKDRTLKHIEKPNVAVISLDPGQLVKIRQEAILADITEDPEGLDSEERSRITAEELEATPLYVMSRGDMKLEKIVESNIMNHFLAHVKEKGVIEMVADLKVNLQNMSSEVEATLNEKYEALEEGSKVFETKIAEGDHAAKRSQNYCIRPKCSNPVKPGQTGHGNPFRLCEEHYEKAKLEAEKKEGSEAAVDTVETEAETTYLKEMEGRVRNSHVATLLYAVLSKVPLTGVDSIVKSAEKYGGSRRLARHLELDIELMQALRAQGVSGIDLDHRIQLMNELTRDTSLNEAWERLTIALNSFKKFSDNEIPTPEPVADKLAAALKADKSDWRKVADEGTGVIDVGSKSAINLLKTYQEAESHGIDIGDKLWSIPTSGKTYELTRRVYLAHGWDENKIIFHDNLNNYETAQLTQLLMEQNGCKASDPATCSYHGRGKAGMDALKSELKAIRDKMNDEPYYRKLNKLMKDNGRFDYCISNPPYQQAPVSKNQKKSRDIYSQFIKLGSDISDVSVMIHPLRAFKSIPEAPSKETKHVMNSEEFSVEMVDRDWKKYFPTVEIKGGVMISRYERGSKNEVNWDKLAIPEEAYSIMEKVRAKEKGTAPVSNMMFPYFTYSAEVLKNNGLKKSDGIHSNHPDRFPDVILSSPPEGEEYVTLYAKVGKDRVERYVRRKDISEEVLQQANGYKVLIAGGIGNGRFGEKISETIVTGKNSVSTRTFTNIGPFRTKAEAIAAQKYLKTRFARMLLSTRKITQNTPIHMFSNIPQQNFSKDSSIDWTGTVAEIDKQLAEKYNLTETQVKWLERNVDEME